MHEVVPSAVSTAEIIDAMICSVHLSVSFFVIVHLLSYKLIICKPYARLCRFYKGVSRLKEL